MIVYLKTGPVENRSSPIKGCTGGVQGTSKRKARSLAEKEGGEEKSDGGGPIKTYRGGPS